MTEFYILIEIAVSIYLLLFLILFTIELFEDWNKKNMKDIEKAIKKEFKWNRIAIISCILGICLCIFSLITHVLSIKHIQEKLDTHIENDTICCHYGMIQVNGVWYDEDDYSQMDWQSYTDTIQL